MGTPPEQIADDDGRVVRVLAGTRQRVAARIVDLLAALLVVMAALSPITVVLLVDDGSAVSAVPWVTVLALVFGVAGPVLLRVGTIARWGCTVGQRVAGIRVVREEDGVRPPGWRRSFRRYSLPKSASSFAIITDPAEHRKDERLGQCQHDRRAKTVVVQAQAPPAAVETGGLAALGSSGPSRGGDHVRRWERRERGWRVLIGSTVGILGAAALSAPFVMGAVSAGAAGGDPAFEVNTFYDDAVRFENRVGESSAIFERTAAKVLDDEAGCLAGATSEPARNVLREAGCDGRIEIAFTTTDGVLVSSHVLRFPDAVSAGKAGRSLRHTDLRFVPGGPAASPGGAQIGRLSDPDRYVVATTAVSPRQADAADKARNAFNLIHGATVRTILFL